MKQFAGWLGLLAIGLFVVFSQVNALDNLEHLNPNHHEQHSIFSVTADDHGVGDHDDGGPSSDNPNDHCHPNVCGTAVASVTVIYEATQYSRSAIHQWIQLTGLTENPARAHERPPKRA